MRHRQDGLAAQQQVPLGKIRSTITEQHQQVQVLNLELQSNLVVVQDMKPMMKTEQQQHAAATQVNAVKSVVVWASSGVQYQ